MDQEKYRLTERVKGQQKALERERELHKDNPNEAMAKDLADQMDSYPFFCETCWEDFTAPAYKTIHRLYGESMRSAAKRVIGMALIEIMTLITVDLMW